MSAVAVPAPPADLLAALEDVAVDLDPWTGRVGPRDLTAASRQELRLVLIGAMYEVFHAGRAEEKDLGRIVRERDVEDVLLGAVPHPTSPRRARVLRREAHAAVVDFGDVRVEVPDHLLPAETPLGELAVLELPAARPALSHGFLLIDGPLGMTGGTTPLRRLYVHTAAPEAAADVWRVVLETLNDARVPYRSKTLSHRDGYPRRDSIVVYLPAEVSAVTDHVAEALRDHGGISPDTSAYAHRIAPGIAIADEPQDVRTQYRELSFGEHRSAVAVNALLRHAEDPDTPLADLFVEECLDARVDPADPAFNLT